MIHKILYIETKPINRQIIFKNRQEFLAFWNPYYCGILDYCWKDDFHRINLKDYYNYQIHKLNKDGSILKKHNPQHLFSLQAKAKQKKNFAVYCEERKKMTLEKGFRRKLSEIDFKIEYWKQEKDLLIKNHKKEIEN